MAFITFVIENKEPLKIGSNGNKSSQKEPTKEYIPGNTLRGAILNKIFRKTGEVTEKLLSQVHFYNAYLLKDEKIFLPTPLHLRANKHEWRNKKASGTEEVNINNLLETSDKGKNNLENRFIAINENNIEGIKVQKTYRLHHSLKKNIDEKDRDNLFRYEAVDVGYQFKGIIHVADEESRQLVLDVLGEGELVLGGSKTTGYGKCIIEKSKIEIKEFSPFKAERLEDSKKLIFTCLSDGLFRNCYGLPTNTLDPSYLKNYFGEVELDRVFIDTSITEGYNVKWGTRLPKETTVKAGSVWVYKMKNPPTNLMEKILEFESKLHGERQNEGYGWIAVNVNYPLSFKLKNKPIKAEKKTNSEVEENLIKQIKEVKKDSNLAIIFSGIQENRIDWIREMAYKEINEGNELKENLTNNQINEMLQIIKAEELKAKDENYLNSRHHTKDKEVFSFKDYNFSEILKYTHKNNNESIENKELSEYAETKLGYDSKEKAFLPKIHFKYWEDEALHEDKKREFIRLLVHEILYLLLRKDAKKGGERNGQK